MRNTMIAFFFLAAVAGCSSHSGGGSGSGSTSSGSTAYTGPAANPTRIGSTTPTGGSTTTTTTTTTSPGITASPAPVTVTPSPAPSPSPSSNCLTSTPSDPDMAYALGLINQARANFGSAPLQFDECMSQCSLRHSQDLANCVGGNFANIGSSANGGSGCAHLDFRNGDTCGAAEENQGVQLGTQPYNNQADFLSVFNAMMAEGVPTDGSSNHCTNILNQVVTRVGIGLYRDSSGYLWITEDFGL